MTENQAKLNADWPGWPAEEQLAAYSEVGLSSVPYGTVVEERFPPDQELPALPAEEPLPPGFTATWHASQSRFIESAAQQLLQKLCERDGLPLAGTSQIDSRAVVLGEERRLAFQPGVPLWVLAWRESVSRSRVWGPAQAARSLLAGAFYRSFLRASYLEPAKDWPEAGDAFCEHLYKSPADHGNGRSGDFGDRPDIPDHPRDWCGAAASFALVDGLRRAGWQLQLPHDWSPLVYRKDWNLDVTEYANLRLPKRPFAQDGNPEPPARAGDILTLVLHGQDAPPTGFFAMVLAARMRAPDSGFVYVASGGTGPVRTVAVDLLRIEPRAEGFRHPFGRDQPRPQAGSAWIMDLNRTSLLQPARRLLSWSKAGLEQLQVMRAK